MSTVSTVIRNPSSFHPISRITFDLESHSTEAEHCSLHLLYKLISSFFIDPYELGQHHESYTFVQWGPTELEKPTHAVQNSDTNVLLTINLPREEDKMLRFDVDVPLHVRYLAPLPMDAPLLDSGSYQHLPFERPQAFFACPRGLFPPLSLFLSLASMRSLNLLDFGQESPSVPPAHIPATQLNEANLMLNITQFIHIPYLPNNPADVIRLPVGKRGDLVAVQVTTAAVVLLAFLWVGAATIQLSQRLFGSSLFRRSKAD